MPRCLPATVALLLLTVSPVWADDLPAGEAAVTGWVPFGRTDQDLAYSGEARLSLTESIELDAFSMHTSDSALAYGEVRLGDLRVGGGSIDQDQGLHLGYSPELVMSLHDTVALVAALDLAVGAGRLGDRSPVADQGPWRRGYEATPADLYAGSLALSLALHLRPSRWLNLSAGIYGDLLATVSAPTPDDLKTPLDRLHPYADRLHPGLSTALSEAGVGAWGSVSVDLWERSRQRLTLSYSEAWDWLHVDPTFTFAQRELLADLDFDPIPPRSTRRIALTWRQGSHVQAGLSASYVRDGTTHEDFADRNGWSIAGHLAGRWGRWSGEVTARYHLQDAALEEYWGAFPRYQVSGSLGWVVLQDDHAQLGLESGVRVTLSDSFGLPREGTVAFARVGVSFGGARPRPPLREEPWFLRPLPPAVATPDEEPLQLARSTDTSSLRQRETELRQRGRELFESLSREDQQVLREELQRLVRKGGRISVRSTVQDALQRHPQLGKRLTTLVVGSQLGAGLLDPEAPAALVVGYSRSGTRLRRASRRAVTTRVDSIAQDTGVTIRDPGDLSFTLTVPHQGRYQVIAQQRSRWTRFMQRLLSGRR